MNHDEKFRAWKARPRPLNVDPGFSEAVMRRIHQQAEQRQRARWNWAGVLEFIQRNPPAQYAVLAAAAIIGLCRFWLMFSAILES